MSHELEEADGYDSIDEDAELELSCALHDLALRVKTFEENMKDRFQHADGDDESEISEEDIPEMDDAVADGRASASPKRFTKHRRRLSTKASKQQSDDDDEDELYDDDDDHEHGGDYEDEDDDDDEDHKSQPRERNEWDFQEQKEELSEMRQNIALLLQTIKAEAKALESHDDDAPVVDDNNQ